MCGCVVELEIANESGVSAEMELMEAVDRVCELAQANKALREKNAVLMDRIRRLEERLGTVEHFVVSQGHVEAFGRWRTGTSGLGGLAAREAGVQAAERYLAKGKG